MENATFRKKQSIKAIELGGGQNPIIHPNADVRKMPNVDYVIDFEQPLPFENNTFDFVYSSYALEHISWRNVKSFVKEIYRILKPDGKIAIVTANLLEQCKAVAASEVWSDNFSCMIFGDQDYPENCHKSGFSPEYIEKIFSEIGFKQSKVTPLPHCTTDMLIEAEK